MFDNFWKVEETIGEGQGFSLFCASHLIEIAICVIATVIMCIIYRRADEVRSRRIRITVAALQIADELFKYYGLFHSGSWLAKYLPLHLCSINIFICTIHSLLKKNNGLLANFLYSICLPGAIIAELTPSWQMLPVANFMHLHSMTVHLLLIIYPAMLLAKGEIRRDYRYIPQLLLMLIIMAIPLHFFNLGFDTNFMFIEFPIPGTPLVLFEKWFGSHLIGYAIFLPLIMMLEYIPFRKYENN